MRNFLAKFMMSGVLLLLASFVGINASALELNQRQSHILAHAEGATFEELFREGFFKLYIGYSPALSRIDACLGLGLTMGYPMINADSKDGYEQCRRENKRFDLTHYNIRPYLMRYTRLLYRDLGPSSGSVDILLEKFLIDFRFSKQRDQDGNIVEMTRSVDIVVEMSGCDEPISREISKQEIPSDVPMVFISGSLGTFSSVFARDAFGSAPRSLAELKQILIKIGCTSFSLSADSPGADFLSK